MPVPALLHRGALILAVAAAGCDPGAPVTPLFSFSNGPAEPGSEGGSSRSGVVRIEGRNAFFIVDETRNLMSFHGQDVTIQEYCAGMRDFDVYDRQFVEVPSGAVEALFVSADEHVWIYPAAPFDCTILVTLPLLASGQARLVQTDNDLLGFGGPGANSFGWTATGTLVGAGGEPVHYTETVRALVYPFTQPGPGEVEEIIVAIRLQ